MGEALFTRLFVETDLPAYVLLRRVAQRLGGTVELNTVTAGPLEVDIRENRELRSPGQAVAPEDGFLYFSLTAEVESETMALDAYLSNVAAVMLSLHEVGAKVVAACDWEDLLPGGGKLGV
jgi:hypothetical protein